MKATFLFPLVLFALALLPLSGRATGPAIDSSEAQLARELAEQVAPLSVRQAAQWQNWGQAFLNGGGQWTADQAQIRNQALAKMQDNTIYASLMKTPLSLYGLKISVFPPPADHASLMGEMVVLVPAQNPSGPLNQAKSIAQLEIANLQDVLPGALTVDWQTADLDPGNSSQRFLAYTIPLRMKTDWPPEKTAEKLNQALSDFKSPRGDFLVSASSLPKPASAGPDKAMVPEPCEKSFSGISR